MTIAGGGYLVQITSRTKGCKGVVSGHLAMVSQTSALADKQTVGCA